MLGKERTDQGPESEVPAEASASDTGESGASAAAEAPSEAEGTVAEAEASPTPTVGGAATEPDDPFAELLKDFVPKKDHDNATRKITQQGQELAARDRQLADLSQKFDALQQTLTQQRQQQETDWDTEGEGSDYQTPTTPANTVTATRLDTIEGALLELHQELQGFNQRFARQNTLQEATKQTGIREDVLQVYQDLKDRGQDVEAAALLSKAAVLEHEQRQQQRKAEQEKQAREVEKIMPGGGARGEATVPTIDPLKPEELPDDKAQRDQFRLGRLKEWFTKG
jgi:uncharacterized membrane protein YdfJ with MMPL/SSD domain